MVPPRKATRRRPSAGIRSRWLVEVADHGVDLEAGVVVGQPHGGRAQELVAHVEGHVAAQRAVRDHGVEQDPGLVARPGPELDQRVGQRDFGDLGGESIEQLALGPGGVVLGQPGDLVEEPAALLVVEPDRRDGLLAAGSSPTQDVVAQRLTQVGRGQMDLDREAGVPRSRLRVPGQAHAAEGPAGRGGEEVAVGGADVTRPASRSSRRAARTGSP